MLQLLNSSAIWLIDQQLVQSYDKTVSVSMSRITGGFPHKGTVMWTSRVRASPNIICMICNRLIACAISHPDDLAIPSISSRWLIVDELCHPDDLPGIGISRGWVTANSLCHSDDILFHSMSSGWLNWGWFLIWMSYGNVIMSSGWDTLPLLSHPDEIANFDFPQHTVALQRFRR